MINQNIEIEKTQNQFPVAMKELQLGKLLRKSNITKSCGVPAYEVFQFLLLLVFQGKYDEKDRCRRIVNQEGIGIRNQGRLRPYGHLVHHRADDKGSPKNRT